MNIIRNTWREPQTMSVAQAVESSAKGETAYYSRGTDEKLEEAENLRKFTVRLTTLLISKGIFTDAEIVELLGSEYEVQK